MQSIPPLDTELAKPCDALTEPPDDMDGLFDWMIDVVGKYGDCSNRHSAVVKAWRAM